MKEKKKKKNASIGIENCQVIPMWTQDHKCEINANITKLGEFGGTLKDNLN